jgi:membrane protein DedA with SNARE-associated domain
MNAMDSLVRYGYLVIFGAVFAEQVGLPFPSEPFLLAGGGLAGSGRLSLVLAIALAAVASLIGDTFWYWLGRTRGPRVMSWLCRMSLEPDSCVRRTHGVFDRWGAKSLVVAKFVPGLSTIAPPLAGVVQMPLSYFVVFSALAGAVWGGAYLVLGWIFSAQLEMVAAPPGRARQLGLRAPGHRDRRLRRLEVREPPAVPQKDQRRADHAGRAQDQARPRRGHDRRRRARPDRLPGGAGNHPGCAPHDGRRARRAASRDPARARHRPLLHVPERGDQRACRAAPQKARDRAHPPVTHAAAAPPPAAEEREVAGALQALPEMEKQAVVEALKRSKGNKSQAAAALGLSRTRFYTLLRRYGLD